MHYNDRYLIQYAVAFSGGLAMFASSASFAWVSPMLVLLQQPDSPIRMTSSQSGWVVFAIMIGRIIAVIPSALAMDRYGRKRTLLVSGVPMLIGWIVCINSTSVEMLYIFRVLCGLTLGAVHTVVLPMYLGEIGSDAIRGSISTVHGVMAKSGICYAFAIGPFVSFRLMGWLELLPIVFFLLTFVWCPESPYWLMTSHRPEDARKALEFLRGHSEVDAELEQIRINIEHAEQNPIRWKDILKKQNRRGLIVTLGLSVGIVMTGTEAILAYAQRLFKEVGSPVESKYVSMISGLILMGTSFVAALIVDRVGRRPMLLLSTIGLFVCNATITFYLGLIKLNIDVSATNVVAMLAVILFVICYGIGLATVTFAVIGEILPRDMKAVAGIVMGLTISLLSMGVMKSQQMLGDSGNLYISYLVYTVGSLLLFPFLWMMLFETKNKPVNEILDLMNNKK